MAEQIVGGFDHIQIMTEEQSNVFGSPAFSVFGGLSPGSEQWVQTNINLTQDYAAAQGPNPGDETLYFTIWVTGDPLVDRPTFHLQAYLGETRVDNVDITCIGPGEMDWIITEGTWTRNFPIPPVCIPGDANCDGVVGLLDLDILGRHWLETGAVWADGDFNGDQYVSLLDLDIMGKHWGMTADSVPEPSVCVLYCLATVAALRRRGVA